VSLDPKVRAAKIVFYVTRQKLKVVAQAFLPVLLTTYGIEKPCARQYLVQRYAGERHVNTKRGFGGP